MWSKGKRLTGEMAREAQRDQGRKRWRERKRVCVRKVGER